MAAPLVENPFTGDAIPEVRLERAPLVRVVAQIRFPKIPELANESGASQLRARLNGRYPVIRDEKTFGVVITSEGITTQEQGERLWRLHDKPDEWRVSISDSFVALDTSKYESRDDFFGRLDEVVFAIAELYEPVLYDRLGVRYVDRLEGDDLADLKRFVRPELHGGYLGRPPNGAIANHVITQAQYTVEDAGINARWGLLPPNFIIDPTVPPTSAPSWVLDLDVFSPGAGDFDPHAIGQLARSYADRAYRFFRWGVTNDFLNHTGGVA